jgi:peroxiredoxin
MRRLFLATSAVLALITALVLLVSAGLPARTGAGELHSISDRAIAPPFQGRLISGDTIYLTGLRGSPVIINFWATWCVPCRLELATLETIYREHQGNGLHVLAVNLGESEATVRDWVVEASLTFDIVLDEQHVLESLYQLRGVPSTFIVDPDGLITRLFYGPVTESQIREALTPFLP